jgi:hypothetical protein
VRSIIVDLTRVAAPLLLVLLAGCSGAAVSPAYTQQELKQQCERRGGWWHDGRLQTGFCEFPKAEMM